MDANATHYSLLIWSLCLRLFLMAHVLTISIFIIINYHNYLRFFEGFCANEAANPLSRNRV